MRYFWILAAAALVGGCAATTDEPRSGINRSLATSTLSADPAHHRIGRTFLLPGAQYLSNDDHPNAVVLLTRDTKKSRAKATCEAFLRLTSVEAARADDPGAHVLKTFWPVTNEVSNAAGCDALIAAYDYDRAQAIASRFSNSDQQGPALVLVQGATNHFLIDLAKANGSAIASVMRTWFDIGVQKSAAGETVYKVPGSGGGLLGKLETITCAVAGVAGAGVPVVGLAGTLLCGGKA